MRFEVRKRPFDLYAIIAASAILVLVILILPELDILRIILGLPFILFFPGYVLISALYPERKRYFDSDGKEIPEPLEEDENEKGDQGEDEDRIKGKGLDGLERVALSLGLSIAITPLIGLVLNYTYDWAPDTLGIRLVPILISQFAFILIVGSIAIYKRQKVVLEDRFAIVLDLSIPEDHTPMDKLLTVGIVIMMVLSVGMLVYIIVVPREGESFTELYILGPGHKADNYPRNIYLEESKFMYIGIGNHEHKDMNYTLVLSLDSTASNQTVISFDNVTISRNMQPSMGIFVEDESTLEIRCNFSVLEVGLYKLRFLLYRDGSEYRDNHIWITVFEDGYLKTSGNGQMEFFVAGLAGDPSILSSRIGSGEPLLLSVGTRNRGDVNVLLNITFTNGGTATWSRLNMTDEIAFIGNGTGAFMEVVSNSTSSSGPFDLMLFLPDGDWNLVVSFKYTGGTNKIQHPVMVGGG